ncbi:MAG: hypothetical protein RBU45_24270, partial [Myxococcota bacterium]|nr:hypothetical protein [Myxococcota bacterium]
HQYHGTTAGAQPDWEAEERGPAVFYTITLAAAASLTVTLTAEEEWDTYLYLLKGDCGALEEVASNDDYYGGGGWEEDWDVPTASQIAIGALEPGEYQVVVSGYDEEAFGGYFLRTAFGAKSECGDGVCDETFEDSYVCPADCTCGNEECEADEGETIETCPRDCVVCGDGVCTEDWESSWSCEEDCTCGNRECQPDRGETHDNCASDCPLCGDDVCERPLGENHDNCADDCPAPPANDTCASAVTITASGEQSVSGTTIGAVPDLSAMRGGDVYYTFTLGAEAAVTATVTSDPAWDTYLVLLKGSCDALETVVTNDDFDGFGSGKSRVAKVLAAGTYFLAVDGFGNDDFGPFDLAVVFGEAPVCGDGTCNEAFETWQTCLEDCPAPIVCGNYICQEGETAESCASDCPTCGNQLCESWLGESKASCGDDCPGAPTNNTCDKATVLALDGVAVNGTTIAATTEYKPRTRGPDVYYKFSLPADSPITLLMATDPAWDTYLFLLKGTCDGYEEVAYNDDSGGIGSGRSMISKETLAAGDYLVVVTGYKVSTVGPFTLTGSTVYTEPEDSGDEWDDEYDDEWDY